MVQHRPVITPIPDISQSYWEGIIRAEAASSEDTSADSFELASSADDLVDSFELASSNIVDCDTLDIVVAGEVDFSIIASS
jgi:hypothetical protein